MSFSLTEFSVTQKFGLDNLRIRPAKNSDRNLVWTAYKNAPKEFFYHIPEITWQNIEMWYPEDKKIDFEHNIPFNVMLLNTNGEEIEFVANVTLILKSISRMRHTAVLGISVLPRYQGKGLGTFLTLLIIEVARAKPNILRLELEVCARNKRARHMYVKCGFQEEGILRNGWLYPNGEFDDVLIMSIVFPEKALS
ncbi:MAG: GNAT family N-acetyltransferase [Candidatus Hodarchaeota archaeon]